jgi:hypothetical protein
LFLFAKQNRKKAKNSKKYSKRNYQKDTLVGQRRISITIKRIKRILSFLYKTEFAVKDTKYKFLKNRLSSSSKFKFKFKLMTYDFDMDVQNKLKILSIYNLINIRQ